VELNRIFGQISAEIAADQNRDSVREFWLPWVPAFLLYQLGGAVGFSTLHGF
jgi:hypothetical protein